MTDSTNKSAQTTYKHKPSRSAGWNTELYSTAGFLKLLVLLINYISTNNTF